MYPTYLRPRSNSSEKSTSYGGDLINSIGSIATEYMKIISNRITILNLMQLTIKLVLKAKRVWRGAMRSVAIIYARYGVRITNIDFTRKTSLLLIGYDNSILEYPLEISRVNEADTATTINSVLNSNLLVIPLHKKYANIAENISISSALGGAVDVDREDSGKPMREAETVKNTSVVTSQAMYVE